MSTRGVAVSEPIPRRQREVGIGRSRHEPEHRSLGNGFTAAFNGELLVDVAAVALHGHGGDAKHPGDLFVSQALGEEHQHLQLALGERLNQARLAESRRGVSRRREGGQERGDEVGGAHSLCSELVQQGRHPRPQVDEDPDHPTGLGQGDGPLEGVEGGAQFVSSIVEQSLQRQRLDQEAGVVSGLHDLVQPGQQARGFPRLVDVPCASRISTSVKLGT